MKIYILGQQVNITSGDYRTNEKTVNGIYLETVAVGNNTFSAAQLSSLQVVAAQCPLSGGEAVLRARDMLALAQDAPTFYNNGNTCGSNARPSQDRVDEGFVEDFVQIRPNPASESITIKYALYEALEHRILLLSVFGQVMGDFPLNDKEGEVTIFVDKLPVGLYWYTVTGGSTSSTSGKLIINR